MSNKIEFHISHLGEYYSNVENFGYKALVIAGPIQNKKLSFGRLIQVRKKSGILGSDTVLLRESDGSLRSYQNMGFFSIVDEFLPLYEKEMREVDNKNIDKEESSYNINGRNTAKGFVVEGLDDTFK